MNNNDSNSSNSTRFKYIVFLFLFGFCVYLLCIVYGNEYSLNKLELEFDILFAFLSKNISLFDIFNFILLLIIIFKINKLKK